MIDAVIAGLMVFLCQNIPLKSQNVYLSKVNYLPSPYYVSFLMFLLIYLNTFGYLVTCQGGVGCWLRQATRVRKYSIKECLNSILNNQWLMLKGAFNFKSSQRFIFLHYPSHCLPTDFFICWHWHYHFLESLCTQFSKWSYHVWLW